LTGLFYFFAAENTSCNIWEDDVHYCRYRAQRRLLPFPPEGGEKMALEMYILAFLVIATGYILSIRGNKK
jgi:hypothetical protein